MDFNAASKVGPDTVKTDPASPPIPPLKYDPLDPAPLVALFDDYVVAIGKMFDTAENHHVVDDETNSQAVEMSTQAKQLAQAIAKQHKEVKAPYLAVIQPLDKFKKGLTDRLADIQRTLNGKIAPYLAEKERQRQESERKAREEAARIQAELDAQAAEERRRLAEQGRTDEAAMVQDPPRVVAEVVPETKVKTETGTAKIKTKINWDVEDFGLIPSEIYESRRNEVKKAIAPVINARIKAGMRNVAGIRVFEEAVVDARVGR